MISDNYRALNKQLHQEQKNYGNRGDDHSEKIQHLCMLLRTQDVLDYGCGKGRLSGALPFAIKQYDPAIEKHSAKPTPSDVVVCTDVLEHIEPEYIDAVLDDLQYLTKKVGFFTIATRPARRTLPDGRNTHLIVEPWPWWLNKLGPRFVIREMVNSICSLKEENIFYNEGELALLVEAQDLANASR